MKVLMIPDSPSRVRFNFIDHECLVFETRDYQFIVSLDFVPYNQRCRLVDTIGEMFNCVGYLIDDEDVKMTLRQTTSVDEQQVLYNCFNDLKLAKSLNIELKYKLFKDDLEIIQLRCRLSGMEESSIHTDASLAECKQQQLTDRFKTRGFEAALISLVIANTQFLISRKRSI